MIRIRSRGEGGGGGMRGKRNPSRVQKSWGWGEKRLKVQLEKKARKKIVNGGKEENEKGRGGGSREGKSQG